MKKLLLVLAQLILLSSCRTADDTEIRYKVLSKTQKDFVEAFKNEYSEPSQDISWITSKDTIALLDISALPADNYTVRFLTAYPQDNDSTCYLLAEYKDLQGTQKYTLAFDYPIGLKKVVVSATNTNGKSYLGTMTIGDGGDNKVSLSANTDYPFQNVPPMQYCIAYEVMSNGEIDFDYNDVVLYVDYVRGRDYMDVSLKAVGIDCYVQLIYRHAGAKGKKVEDVVFEEAHASLGYPAVYNYFTKRNVYYFLNTGINETGKIARKRIEIDGEESGGSICSIAPKLIVYFMSNDKDRKSITESSIPTKKGSLNAQAILLSAPNWFRTSESMGIHVIYPEFSNWLQSPAEYPFWYTTCWDNL